MGKSKVYLVTDGDYSDFGVLAVFSTKELADKYLDPFREVRGVLDLPNIEEFELDPATPLVACTWIYMKMDGKPVKEFEHTGVFGPEEVGFIGFNGPSNTLIWLVGTIDRQRALKIVNEKRTQILAQSLWGDSEKVRQLFGGKIDGDV